MLSSRLPRRLLRHHLPLALLSLAVTAAQLLWAFDMAAVGQALQPHLWGRLVRQ